MATTINSNTTDGIIITPDLSGEIKLQSDGTDIATVDSSGITMASGKNLVQPNTPTFRATLSASQSLTASADQKVNFNVADFDTTSDFDTSNYRFTPSVAGYYWISFTAGRAYSTGDWLASIYKNGSEYTRGQYSASGDYGIQASGVVYLNGSTDYVEAYVYNGSTTGNLFSTSARTHFDGFLIQKA